ncbi:hypothetical protein SAMN04488168_1056 [Bacillus sp. 491mf]|uniref:hypothetical protein n=1 Tax=Bacillus sp. 491mf TaxID=1761755 RepID=UPI0008EA072C|nr:hypothetical protein [Bacillus sp. 491mf]SFC46573.1 hypothetical protein SAMN04488168_1056 [Bacillus sp. 491mf]
MNILNWLISLFNFGRGTRRVFQLFGIRRTNRNWIWISLLGIGTVFGLVASRNFNMITPLQRLFRDMQNRTRAIMPTNLNLASMEIANEITPNSKKSTSINQTRV